MLVWFAGLSFVLVVAVFRDAAIDHRLVMTAAVLPSVADLAVGGFGPFHTLVWCVGLLVAVMLGTIGRRPARRRLLALPVGAFFNLVLDGAWQSTRLVAWPLLGTSFPDPPLLDRPWALRLAMDAAGAAALAWAVARFRLLDPRNRERFLRSGRLDRQLVGPSGR